MGGKFRMSKQTLDLTTPVAFFEFAKDDPDRWKLIKGRKVRHCELGVGRITDIVRVTYDGSRKITCGGILVVFGHDAVSMAERFNTSASADATFTVARSLSRGHQPPLSFNTRTFADGTFTAFVEDTEEMLKHIRDALSRLDLAQASHIVEDTEEILQHIRDALSRLDLEKASHLYDCYKEQIEKAAFDYEAEAKPYLDLYNLLRKHDFGQADAFFMNHDVVVEAGAYEQSKAEHLIDYFHSRRVRKIDHYKGLALAKLCGNVLVTARAGSGKTTLLTHLTSLLVDRYGVDPHAILVLAFNRKAAQEIGRRIVADLQLPKFANARTFHSLAFQVVRPTTKILYDNNDETFAADLSQFVQDVLRRINKNSAFWKKMHTVFRAELQELERSGSLLSNSDYLMFRRNLSHITLKNEYVKSTGEKIIADFLFEHGIQYRYEHPVYWGSSVYRPDFTFSDGTQEIIIEHWALDPDDPNATLPEHWTTNATEYRNEIDEKRKFWRTRKSILLETSTRDLRAGRKAFERRLESLILGIGMPYERLDEKTLEKEVRIKHLTRMTKLFVQFIQKCKKQRWTAEEAAARVRGYRANNDRENVFLGLAVRVYAEYEKALARENYIDFDILMESAVTVLNKSQGRCSVRFDRQELFIPDLRWILIDEYQDFSPQFSALLQSLRQHNPEIRLFCVGDDWQAINRFAGSDLSFFHEFADHFDNSAAAVLPTNYRSHKAIVEAGNLIMQDRGTPGEWLPDKLAGELHERNIDEVWIECRPDDQHAKAREADKRFRFLRTLDDGREISDDSGETVARYLKCVYEIMTEQRNLGKTVAFLSRTNRFHHLSELKKFIDKLIACFTPEQVRSMGGRDSIKKNIRIGTAHSFKGLEADIVFLLHACKGAFPLIHPDYVLFGLFGDTEQQILEDERRLFYVAVTRAREQLWFLTETERQSDFVQEILGDCNSNPSPRHVR